MQRDREHQNGRDNSKRGGGRAGSFASARIWDLHSPSLVLHGVAVVSSELDMDWIYPFIGLDWIGLGGMTMTPF